MSQNPQSAQMSRYQLLHPFFIFFFWSLVRLQYCRYVVSFSISLFDCRIGCHCGSILSFSKLTSQSRPTNPRGGKKASLKRWTQRSKTVYQKYCVGSDGLCCYVGNQAIPNCFWDQANMTGYPQDFVACHPSIGQKQDTWVDNFMGHSWAGSESSMHDRYRMLSSTVRC
jgi:hypothetical protein